MKRKKELNPYFAGALISGGASIVEEVGGRMRAGLSFKEALSETFTDRKSLAAIGAKAAIGSLTLGVTSDVAVACTRRMHSSHSGEELGESRGADILRVVFLCIAGVPVGFRPWGKTSPYQPLGICHHVRNAGRDCAACATGADAPRIGARLY